MTKIKLIIYFALLFYINLISTGCVQGQTKTYYVSENGDNDKSGLSDQEAFASIQMAVDIVNPGDSIIVLKGHYKEYVKVSNSGKSGREIIIISKPKNAAFIEGGFEIKGSFIRISGFRITNKLQNWPNRIAIHIEGNYIDIIDNYLFEVQNEAIRGSWKAMPGNVLIENNKIYHSQMGIVVEGENWIIRNNEVERMFDYGNGDCDYSRFFGNNHKFIANKFHGTLNHEIGKSHVDCFQTFDNNGQYAHNILIEKNYCEDFMQGFMGEAHFHHNISNILFRNNIFKNGFQHNSHGMIVQDIPGVVVLNNNFINIKWRGVTIQAADNRLAKNAVIKNNIFFNCGTSYSYFDQTSFGDFNLIFMTKNNPNIGAHDIVNKDPLIYDIPNGDYRLREDSPAIDAGTATEQVKDDIYNNRRPVNFKYDIGAAEYINKNP